MAAPAIDWEVDLLQFPVPVLGALIAAQCHGDEDSWTVLCLMSAGSICLLR